MARIYDETCWSCGRLVLREEGVAFQDDRVADLGCFIGHVPNRTAGQPSLPPNRILFGVHVLITEDGVSTAELLRAALEYSGGFVSTARNATEGKAVLRTLRPNVLVTDIAMPNNGLAMIREVIRFASDTGRTIPAVAISAVHDGRHHLRDAGYAAFLPKPIDPLVLATLVAKLARRGGAIA
jgi:CheY-like chemotaxis protein